MDPHQQIGKYQDPINGATPYRKMVLRNMIKTQQVSIIWGQSIYLCNWRKTSMNICEVRLIRNVYVYTNIN
jgi:hypothetical protein